MYIVAEPYLPPTEENTCDAISYYKPGYYCSTSGQYHARNLEDNARPMIIARILPMIFLPAVILLTQCEVSEGTCLKACQDAELPPDMPSNSTLECANDEARGDVRGECTQQHDICVEAIDCKNPSNSYMTTKYIGYVSCQGVYARTCSSSSCPDGESEVRCFAQPSVAPLARRSEVRCFAQPSGAPLAPPGEHHGVRA
jgi:hypothetical protein